MSIVNGSYTELNISSAFSEGWIGVSNTDQNLIRYWKKDADLGDVYETVSSTESLEPWRGYFIWSRQNNITLMRQN